MFAYPQQTREITCPSSHSLMKIDDLCQLYGGQSYTKNVYWCDTCRGEFNSKYNPSSHCMTCGFDMCPGCYETQKLVQISCPQNHPLLKVRALQKFSNYSSNRYKCNSCKGSLDSSINASAHCRACKYDLCPNCLANAQCQPQMNFQLSYQQQEQVKRSGNPSSMPFRQITCKNNHILSPVNNLKQLHPTSHGIYSENTFACDTCRRKYTCSPNTFTNHCSSCKFDMCSGCYEAQKTIRTSCPKSHPLFLVTAIQAFANYTSNTYRCNSCLSSFNAAQNPTAHCNSCNYDLCPNCLAKSQTNVLNNDERQQMQRDGNLKQVTCPARHILSPVNNLHQLHPSSGGTYASNVYVCDTCRLKFKCQTDNSYHCQACKFDVCPNCYQKDQRVNFDCSAGHPLYIVSNLKGFNEKTNSYVQNSYVCNSCRGSRDAAMNPSCHCRQCKFDLCPGCFEARKNQIDQMKNNQQQQQQQYYQMQQNNNQQQYNQIPQYNNQYNQVQQNNNQYYQMPQNNVQQYQNQQNYNQQYQNQPNYNQQYQNQPNYNQQYQSQPNYNQQYQMQNLQQNFANFSIQEPIKQSAPPQNPEEAKNNQPQKNLPDEMLCVVCLSDQRSHLFTPCMHLCACARCSFDVINQQKGCPMCRSPIQSSAKVFMS